MLAKRLPTIMPAMDLEESLEITRLYSICGLLPEEDSVITRRPFRAPHHTITQTALTGGGRIPMPGEITLAAKGVLFLDELPEFSRSSLEVLRQPLEEHKVTVSRLGKSYEYPSDCIFVAAMNIATTKLIQWETAEKPENKAFRGFCGFIFSLFEPFFC